MSNSNTEQGKKNTVTITTE